MKNARPELIKSSAPVTGASKSNRIINQRQRRALEALLNCPVWREQLDRIAGASNSPQLVSELRRLGLVIKCERIQRIDRDGRTCLPGLYRLLTCSVERARALLEVVHE